MLRDNCSKIGLITKPHGIDGNVIVRLDGAFADDIEPGEPLFVEIDGTLVPFFVEEIRPMGDTAYLTFEFIRSAADADILRNRKLYADNEFLSRISPGMSPTSTLTGYLIKDENTGFTATVQDFIENPLNPLFLAVSAGKEFYIPAQEDLIRRIDRKKKILYMDLPEGFGEI